MILGSSPVKFCLKYSWVANVLSYDEKWVSQQIPVWKTKVEMNFEEENSSLSLLKKNKVLKWIRV